MLRGSDRCARLGLGAGLVVALVAANPATAQAGGQSAELVGPGSTRVHRVDRVRLTPAQIEARRAAGKTVKLDPETSEMLLDTFADHLPAGWIMHLPEQMAGARVDSLGNPIVNETPGLPAWAQRDVDALREAIGRTRDEAARVRALGQNDTETSGVLGNFLGQAIVRGINVDDVVNIDDAKVVNPGVAGAILDYIHFYENIRFANQEIFRYAYTPTEYPARIGAFAARFGADLRTLQTLEPIETNEPRGGQPSGCYARTAFARGMTNLSGQTDIWVANGFDDASADIPTGLPLFFFYDCQDRDNNDMVRVSTNGYISFFQQGGGATFGTSFGNDPIPLAEDPDGYAAPWWDDLFVATSQGSTDRVSYKTEGAVDLRVFTVEWISISRLDGNTTDFHYFQVKLYETTDVVELHYGLDVSGWSPDSLDNATAGIENYTGAGGDCGPNCLNTNSQPPPNDYRFTPAPGPDNDNCGNAIERINGASVTGDLHRATPDGVANCGDSNNNRDLWYTFVARCNGTLHLDTCGSRDIDGPGTGIDTVLSVHSGCPGTLANQLACNDDAGAAGCSANDSEISVPMVVGQRVFIRVTHFGDIAFRFLSGEFRLNLNFLSSSPPANDNCGGATLVSNGSNVTGNLLCASNDGSSDCGSSETNPDIWYRFTAPFSGRLTVDVCGSRNNAGTDTGPDTVISIHSACPGDIANEIACNDDGFIPGCNTLDSRVSALLSSGEQVRVRVSHFGDNAFRVGNGVVRVHAVFVCIADFNGNGVVNSQDFFDFLSAFFANNPAADVNLDGTVNSQDFFDFLTSFFGGC